MAVQEPHAGHTDCSEVLHRIYEYLDGEMSGSDVTRVAQHLAECQPCLDQHDLDLAMKALVKRSCAGDHAPATLRVQIIERLTVVRLELER